MSFWLSFGDQALARSVGLELADHLAVSTSTELDDGLGVHVLREETDAAVAEESVASTDVEAEGLIVWTAVVRGPCTGRWSAIGRLILVDDLATVCRWTGNPGACIGVSPTIGA